MVITDEKAIAFCNEQVRPLAEIMRELDYRLDSFISSYFAGPSTAISADGTGEVEDGRESEGINTLTGNDVMAIVTRAQSLKAVFDASNAKDCIHKACVRPYSG